MNRREALRGVAFLMGGTVIGAQAFLTGCKSEDKAVSDLFKQSDVNLMDEVAETIIPTTDTPGAKAAAVGPFMAMMVKDCYVEKDQKIFQEGLVKLRNAFEDEYGHSFMKGTAEERHAFISKINEEFEGYNKNKKEEEPEHYFRMMKELSLLGYFSSEIGCTQALRYVETPGRYDACIPYQKGDRAWAT